MHPQAERMSRVDTAWLRMDSGVNRMAVVGVLLLEPALSLAALRERVRERLVPMARFRQRVEHDAVGALWVEDEGFDLSRHVFAVELNPGAEPSQPQSQAAQERAALQERCGLLASVPFDESRPLWQMQLVERYGAGSALIVRVHHCIADGMALIALMLGLSDGAQPPGPSRFRKTRAGASGARLSADDRAEIPAEGLQEALLRPLAEVAFRALQSLGDGAAPAAGLKVLQDVAEIALMPDDSATALKGPLAGSKRVAWGDPLVLDEVKAVAKALACSVNDVLMACAAGAIGQWLQETHPQPVKGKSIRALVPVNLRPLHQAWQLGNRFGLVPLLLPIGLPNPVERLYTVRERMQRLKSSSQPMLSFAVLSFSGLMAKPLQDSLLGVFSRKATAVMTNVPGPAQALSVCGSTVRQPLFWVPASGEIGLGLSILSYAGGVQIGLMSDALRCSDPQAIVERFSDQFQRLLWLTLMLPCADEMEAA